MIKTETKVIQRSELRNRLKINQPLVLHPYYDDNQGSTNSGSGGQ